MDHEKPIICFTSTRRLSSSPSMKKLHSKSILSPNRSTDNNNNKQISLSASLSRRLRTNTSMKGGQSPMFPTGSKKRGSGFENTEPTSPKVTCIGQVRVKTKKKQLNQMRSLSNRRSGEASFRKIEPKSDTQSHQNLQFPGYLNTQEGLQQRNQKWVHLPLTICEALRGFGSEINCFLPCKSSCFSRVKEKDAVFQQSSCFYREIEIVVGGEEDQVTERSYHRRHVMEDIDISELEKCNVVVEQQEGGRVSICVPPKNALLLMRCRSDPLKMASLANKFWESNVDDEDEEIEHESVDILEVDKEIVEKVEPFEVDQETEHVEDEEIVQKLDALEVVVKTENEKGEDFEDLVVHEACLEEDGVPEETSILVMEMNGDDLEDTQKCFDEFEHVHEDIMEIHQELIIISSPSQEILEIHENQSETTILQQNNDVECEADEVPRTSIQLYSVSHWFLESEDEEIHEMEPELAETEESISEEKSTSTHQKHEFEPETHEIDPPVVVVEEERLEKRESRHENRVIPESKNRALPDCLLMMMCEPKLSMEVSKETWVCTTDFIRCVPSSNRKKVNKTNGGDEVKKRVSIDYKPRPPIRDPLLQPPRSSVSFPISSAEPFSMAAMIEQKLGNSAAAYEPFGLTRCKSAPIRSAAPAKFAKPEACYWRNRKMEPHRGAAVGVGAVGF